MPIPEIEEATGVLPAGVHEATLDEVGDRFGTTYQRRQLQAALCRVVEQLRQRGVNDIWVDGSYVTDKRRPRDVDVVYRRPTGSDVTQWGLLSPNRRRDLHKREKVDLLPDNSRGDPVKRLPILEYFQQKHGEPKGIIKLVW